MSKRGVLQATKLIFKFCDYGGSSRGTREFLRENLDSLAKQRPDMAFEPVLSKGSHPFITAEFLNGKTKTMCIKNHSSKEVGEKTHWMMSETGRTKTLHSGTRVVSRFPSIQGIHKEVFKPWTDSPASN